MARREAGRKGPPVPVAHDHPPAVARQFVGKVLGITDAEKLQAWPVAEAPGRKRHRGEMRLQMTRRLVDDQPADPALVHRHQLRGDDPVMPVRDEFGLRMELVKRTLGKTREIGAQQGLVFGEIQTFGRRAHSLERSLLSRFAMTFSSAAPKDGSVGGAAAASRSRSSIRPSNILVACVSAIANLLASCLRPSSRLEMRRRLPSSVTTTGSFNASASRVEKFFEPLGRPRRLPDWPF